MSIKKYSRFYKRSEKGSKNAMFDICAYKKFDSIVSEFVEKTKLLTEYVIHEEGMSYSELETLTGMTRYHLVYIRYSTKASLKIITAIKTKRPDIWDNFHKFYDWGEPIDTRRVKRYNKDLQEKD